MPLSVGGATTTNCSVCQAQTPFTMWLVVSRAEQPEEWARARRGGLNEALCAFGHRTIVRLPQLFYEPQSKRLVFCPTSAAAAEQELANVLQHVDDPSGLEGLEVEIVEEAGLTSALAALERAVTAGSKPPEAFSRRSVVIRLGEDDPGLEEALERPNPETARRIALRCEHLLDRYKPDERKHALLSAHRAWCLSLEPGASQAQLQEAVDTLDAAAAALSRGQKTELVAAKRNLGEALLRLKDGDAEEIGLRALAAFDAILDHLEGSSFEDWARTWVGYVTARLRAYPEEDRSNAVNTLELVLRRTPPPLADLPVVAAAKALLAEVRAPQASAGDAEDSALQQLMVRFNAQDSEAVLAQTAQALVQGLAGVSRPVLLFMRSVALLRDAEVTPEAGREAVVLLEEAIESSIEDEVPLERVMQDLPSAYAAFSKEELEDLPVFVSPSPRLADVLLEDALRLVGSSDLDLAGAVLRRLSILLRNDSDRVGLRWAVRDTQRETSRRIGDLMAAAIHLDQYDPAAELSRAQMPPEHLAAYLETADSFVDALQKTSEPEPAARLLTETADVRWALAEHANEPEVYAAALSRLTELMLRYGAHSDAFRVGAQLVDYAEQRDLPARYTVDGRLAMALALQGLGAYEGALAGLEEIRGLEPEFEPHLAQHIANTALAAGWLDRARAALMTADAERNQILFLELKAREREGAGDREEAAALYERLKAAKGRSQLQGGVKLRALTRMTRRALADGDLAAAQDHLAYAFKIQKWLSNGPHASAPELFELLCELEARLDRSDAAFQAIREATGHDAVRADDRLSLGSAEDRRRHLQSMRQRADRMVDLVVRHFGEDPKAIGDAYQAVLRVKALNAGIEQLNQHVIRDAAKTRPAAADLLARLDRVRADLAEAAVARAGAALEAAARSKSALESALSRHANSVAVEAFMEWSDLGALSRAIPPAAVFVDYVRHRGVTDKPIRYMAFVLPGRGFASPGIHVVDLGEAAAIDEMVARFRTEMANPPGAGLGRLLRNLTGGGVGEQLRVALVEPLREWIGSEGRLLLSLDGPLSTLPFEALPNGREGLLIDDFLISHLASARDLDPRPPEFEENPGPPLIIGAPDYADVGEGAAGCGDSRAGGLLFGPLPATREEAVQIAAMFGVAPVLGREASKATLSATRSPHVLHLATHGYFLRRKAAPALAAQPLLRSGLALAGANLRNSAVGLLTAEEVLSLDLRFTELLVLSACETALGEPEEGEALAGLARCFEAAGAKSVVVGLWRVPDAPTQELMVSFYKRLSAGEGRAEALRNAKLALRKTRPATRDWAGFVLRGASGPLQWPAAETRERSE